jgi:hypothetical protein
MCNSEVDLEMICFYLSQKTFMDTNQNRDLFPEQKKELPGMLNVLTILTFIGCGLSYIGTLWGFYQSTNYENEKAELEELRDKSGDNEFANKMMDASLEMLEKNYENRYILLLSGLLFTTLCLVGALQMRKLKKSGYMIYLVGELTPVILTAILIGFSLVGGITTLITAIVAILFVVLYSTQRKYLVN